MKYIGLADKNGIRELYNRDESKIESLMKTSMENNYCYFEVTLGEHSIEFLNKEKDSKYKLGFMKLLAQELYVPKEQESLWDTIPHGLNI